MGQAAMWGNRRACAAYASKMLGRSGVGEPEPALCGRRGEPGTGRSVRHVSGARNLPLRRVAVLPLPACMEWARAAG